MKLSDIKIQKPPEYYCKTCKQLLDPRQVAYHEKFGHTVKHGEHGFTIWFPVGQKDEDGELLTAEKFFTATVFDISQTENLTTGPSIIAETAG